MELTKLPTGQLDDGEIVELDPHRPRRGERHSVVLWSERDHTFPSYDREIARLKLKVLDDPLLITTVLKRYSARLRNVCDLRDVRRAQNQGDKSALTAQINRPSSTAGNTLAHGAVQSMSSWRGVDYGSAFCDGWGGGVIGRRAGCKVP